MLVKLLIVMATIIVAIKCRTDLNNFRQLSYDIFHFHRADEQCVGHTINHTGLTSICVGPICTYVETSWS